MVRVDPSSQGLSGCWQGAAVSQCLARELLVASVACEQEKELGQGARTRGLILGWPFGAPGAGLDDPWGSLPTRDILRSKVKKEASVSNLALLKYFMLGVKCQNPRIW